MVLRTADRTAAGGAGPFGVAQGRRRDTAGPKGKTHRASLSGGVGRIGTGRARGGAGGRRGLSGSRGCRSRPRAAEPGRGPGPFGALVRSRAKRSERGRRAGCGHGRSFGAGGGGGRHRCSACEAATFEAVGAGSSEQATAADGEAVKRAERLSGTSSVLALRGRGRRRKARLAQLRDGDAGHRRRRTFGFCGGGGWRSRPDGRAVAPDHGGADPSGFATAENGEAGLSGRRANPGRSQAKSARNAGSGPTGNRKETLGCAGA